MREDSEVGLELALLLLLHALELAAPGLVGDGVVSDLGDDANNLELFSPASLLSVVCSLLAPTPTLHAATGGELRGTMPLL